MMRSIFISSLLFLVFLIPSAMASDIELDIPPYQIISSQNGIFRLNRNTGQVSKIINDRLVPVEEQSAKTYFKQWKEEQFNGFNYSLKTNWIDGAIYFSLLSSKSPESDKKRLPVDGITFCDENNIEIHEIRKGPFDKNLYVGEPKKEMEGSSQMSLQKYNALKSWDLVFSLERSETP